MEAITSYLFFYSLSPSFLRVFRTHRRWAECVIIPPRPIQCFYRANNNISDLWGHQEGLRKAIKKLLAGGNIPTRVVTLIYLAGLCISASQHLSLLPQPHPCCSEICTPIKRYRCLRCREDRAAFCWSVCFFRHKGILDGQSRKCPVNELLDGQMDRWTGTPCVSWAPPVQTSPLHVSSSARPLLFTSFCFFFRSLFSVSETIASRFHPSTALEPQGLKIELINIACFDWFNINAKIVSH